MKKKKPSSLIAAAAAVTLSLDVLSCNFSNNTLYSFAESSFKINEVCTQNKNSITDGYGTASDWIEFYNASGKSADISGWSLTDSSQKPFCFPDNTVIPANSYLVIFAGGGVSLPDEFHTDFGLSKSGEPLTLYDNLGNIVQTVDVPALSEDQTYSYDSSSDKWAVVSTPTPAKANVQGISAPTFTLPSGFYDASQSNYLEINGSGEIYYTLDGSNPKTSPTAIKYSDRILLTDRTSENNVLSLYDHKNNDPTSITISQSCYPPNENVDKIYTFRAAARSGSNWSSEVNSTYIVMEGEKLQKYKDVPIISVTTESSNLFDPATGIYVVGEQFLTWLKTNRVSNEWDSSIPTNFYSRGREWERPAIVSMFRDGEEIFTQNAGIRIRGNSTRNAKHKGFSIFARSEYGDSKFNYKIIEGNISADDGKKIKKYDSFAVRANSWVDRIRDGIVQEALEILPDDATLDRNKGVMFIDGEFWGFVDIQEKYSDYYFQSNYGIPSEDVAYLKDGLIEEGSDTDQNDYDRMIYFASKSDMSKASNYKTFTDEVDVETFADHFAVGIYTGMWDWPDHNYVAWRNNGAVIDGNKYSDGKWRFGTFDFDYTSALSYDTNYSGGAAKYNHFEKISKGSDFTAKAFFNLMNNSEFREIFIRRFCDMGNIVMSPEKMKAIVSDTENYQQYLMDEYLRWGSEPNMNKDSSISWWIKDTESDRRKMIEFYDDRPYYSVEQMCSFFNLNKNIISTEVSIEGDGKIIVNNIPVSEAVTLKYPESTKIMLSAVAPEGQKFVGWKGDVTSSSAEIEVTADKARTVTAVFASDDSFLCGDVNCDKTVSIADLVTLQSWIIKKDAELKNWKNADLTEDGVINSSDIAALRKLILRSEMLNGNYYANEENVRYIGRNLYSDNVAWLVQSGSAIEFTVTGKSAEITLVGDQHFEANIDTSPRYAVFVDGKLLIDEVLMEKNKTIKLFSEESEKTAQIKVIHLSEAQYATFGVSGIRVDSMADNPVVPTKKKKLQIEFIGDSITCGYGVEGTENSTFSTSTENFMKTYAYLASEELDADYSAESNGGYGILSGVSFDGTINSKQTHPRIYCDYGPFEPYDVQWDFDSHPNDIIVLNIGANDATYIGSDTLREREFKEKYLDFLSLIHEKNPDSYIICTVGTMNSGSLVSVEKSAVEEFRKTTGWDKILFYESVKIQASDGYGTQGHPNEITHRKNAEKLVEVIKGIL